MKLFKQFVIFFLWLLTFAVIIKYMLLPKYLNTPIEGVLQDTMDDLVSRIRTDYPSDDLTASQDHKDEKNIKTEVLDDVKKGKTNTDLSKKNIESQKVLGSIQPLEALAIQDETPGLYMYLNTDIDISDKNVVEELVFVLDWVADQNENLYVRPMGDQTNNIGLLLRGGYICSGGGVGYRSELSSILQLTNSTDIIRRDLGIRAMTNNIQGFDTCLNNDSGRTLLLSRAVKKNTRSYPDDSVIDLIRIVIDTKK